MKLVLRFRAKDKDLFAKILSGKKTIETRAATTKYETVQKGDILVLTCGTDKLEREIKSVKFFKSIDQLAKQIDINSVIPNTNSLEEAKSIYFSFPGYKEKIEKFGLVAFEI